MKLGKERGVPRGVPGRNSSPRRQPKGSESALRAWHQKAYSNIIDQSPQSTRVLLSMDLYVPREKTLTEESPGLKRGKLQSENRKSTWFFLSKENSTGHTCTGVQRNCVDVEEVTWVRPQTSLAFAL